MEESPAFPLLAELGVPVIRRTRGNVVYCPKEELRAKLLELNILPEFEAKMKGVVRLRGGYFAWDAEMVLQELLNRKKAR